MARKFAVEISIGVSQGELAQAERAYKRLGMSAEDAMKRTEALATSTDKGGTKMREATVKAAAQFERFHKAIAENRGADLALLKLNTRIEDLRQEIERAQQAGAPVDPQAIATLRELDAQTARNIQSVGRLKAEQDDLRDAIRDSKGTFDGQGRQINSLGDLFDVAGGKVGKFGLQVIAAVGAMKAGYQIGEDLRNTVNALGKEVLGVSNLMDKLVRGTREFTMVAKILNAVVGESTSDLDAYNAAQQRFIEANNRRLRSINNRPKGDPFADLGLSEEEWQAVANAEIQAREEAARAAEQAADRASRAAEQAAERELAAIARVVAARQKLFDLQWQQFQQQSLGIGTATRGLGSAGGLPPEVSRALDEWIDGIDTSADSLDAATKMEAKYQERLIANSRAIDEQIAGWAGLFNFLADELGGVFEYVATAMNALQNARALSQQTSSLLGPQGMGMSAQGAGAAGAMLGTAYAFYVLYKEVSASIKRGKLQQYAAETEFSISGGKQSATAINEQGREALNAIRGVIETFERALRISVTDLDKIGIRIRNDGKYIAAYVGTQMIGHFEDINDAIRAALQHSIISGKAKFSGLSDLMAQSLSEGVLTDPDEFMAFMSQLRAISDMSLSEGAIALQETVRGLGDLWEALGKMREATPAVVEGFNNLIAAESRAWQAWSDSITGRQKTAAELLAEKKAEAEIFNAQKALRVAELKMREMELQGQAAALVARKQLLQRDAELRTQELALYQAQLEAIARLIKAIGGIADIDPLKIRLPGLGGAGGGGPSAADDGKRLRDMLRDSGATEYEAALRAIQERWKEAIPLAHGNKDLLDQIAEARRREIDQLRKHAVQAAVDAYRSFTGKNSPFDDLRKQAEAAAAAIADSPMGDARKARMIANIWNSFAEQSQRMADQLGAGLLGQLAADLEAIGGNELQAAELRRHMAILEHGLKMAHYRTEIEILRAAGLLAPEVLAAFDAALAILGDFNPAHGGGTPPPAPGNMGQGSDEIVEANGFKWKWTGTQWINLGPVAGAGGGSGGGSYRDWWGTGGSGGTDPAKALADELKRAKDMLADWQKLGVHPLTRELNQLAEDFAFLQRVLGDTAEVHEAYNRKLKDILDRYLEPIRAYRRGMDFSPTSPLRGDQQFFAAQSQFRQVLGQIQGGDLTALDRVTEVADLYRTLARDYTAGEAFRFIDSEIRAALDSILAIAPQIAGGSTPMGAPANPMTTASPALQQSLETGNTMIVSELRQHSALLTRIAFTNDQMANSLDNPLTVRNIA